MKVAVTNNRKTRITRGGVGIQPGQTRYVEETLLPDYKPQAKSKPEQSADPMAELLDKPARELVEMVSELSDEQIDALAEAEQSREPKPRTTVIQALETERLERARRATEQEVAALSEEVSDLSDEELDQRLDEELDRDDTRDEVVELLEAEKRRRAEPDA